MMKMLRNFYRSEIVKTFDGEGNDWDRIVTEVAYENDSNDDWRLATDLASDRFENSLTETDW